METHESKNNYVNFNLRASFDLITHERIYKILELVFFI